MIPRYTLSRISRKKRKNSLAVNEYLENVDNDYLGLFFVVEPELFDWNEFKTQFDPPYEKFKLNGEPTEHHYSESNYKDPNHPTDKARKSYYHYNLT